MATNLFGAPQPNAQTTSTFGGLGGGQPPASGLGLFSQPGQSKPPQAQQPAAGGLFGTPGGLQPTQQTSQKSLFGGNFGASNTGAPQQPQNQGATQTTLNFGQFASNPAAAQAGTPFGVAPQTNAFGLGSGQPQNQQATGALCQTQKQGSLFGAVNQPQFGGGQPFLSQTLQQQPQQQQQMMMMYQQQFTAEQKASKEVADLLNLYSKSLNMTNGQGGDQNRFRGCLYNKIDKKVTRIQKKQIHEKVPIVLGNELVDTFKWMQAEERNPDKNLLVPTQIASVQELKQRVQKVLQDVRAAKSRVANAQEQLNIVEKTCDGEVSQGLKNCQERNDLIKKRLAQIFGKFERVLTEQGRVDVDRRPQDELISRQHALLRQLCEPQTGLQRQLEQIKQSNHQALTMSEHFSGSDVVDGKFQGQEIDKQQVEDADLREIFNVLKSQKQGIEILQKSVRSSASQLLVMEKEINL